MFQMVDWVLRFLNRVCSVYLSIDEIVQADERQDNGREQLHQEGNHFIHLYGTFPFYINSVVHILIVLHIHIINSNPLCPLPSILKQSSCLDTQHTNIQSMVWTICYGENQTTRNKNTFLNLCMIRSDYTMYIFFCRLEVLFFNVISMYNKPC